MFLPFPVEDQHTTLQNFPKKTLDGIKKILFIIETDQIFLDSMRDISWNFVMMKIYICDDMIDRSRHPIVLGHFLSQCFVLGHFLSQ